MESDFRRFAQFSYVETFIESAIDRYLFTLKSEAEVQYLQQKNQIELTDKENLDKNELYHWNTEVERLYVTTENKENT